MNPEPIPARSTQTTPPAPAASAQGGKTAQGGKPPASAAAGVSLSDMTKEFQAAKQGDAAARRALNSLAVTSNFVAALIAHPGPNSSHDSMVHAARTMLRSADQMTQTLVESLGLEALPWARYRVMRVVSGAVAARWGATSRQGDEPNADVTGFLPVWQAMAANNLPEVTFDDPATEPATALRIAMLDAMQPVMEEIAVFEMLHDPKNAATHARDTIVLASQQALATMASDPMSDRSKSLLMQALLRNGGSIYASAWRRHAEDTVEQLQSMDKTQQAALIELNAGGLPLAPIDQAFSGSFVKLVEMVQYLAAAKAPAVTRDAEDRPGEYDESSEPRPPVAGAASA